MCRNPRREAETTHFPCHRLAGGRRNGVAVQNVKGSRKGIARPRLHALFPIPRGLRPALPPGNNRPLASRLAPHHWRKEAGPRPTPRAPHAPARAAGGSAASCTSGCCLAAAARLRSPGHRPGRGARSDVTAMAGIKGGPGARAAGTGPRGRGGAAWGRPSSAPQAVALRPWTRTRQPGYRPVLREFAPGDIEGCDREGCPARHTNVVGFSREARCRCSPKPGLYIRSRDPGAPSFRASQSDAS